MINIGIVGCGYWGSNLIRNVLQCDRTRLMWVCDINPETFRRNAWMLHNTERSTNLDTLLRNPKNKALDAVIIATPAHTHFELAWKLLDENKHVLVEKPLADNISEGRALKVRAKEKGLVLKTDYTYIYHNVVRKIKEIVDSGELGDILYYDSVRVNLGLFHSDVNIIWDLAPHDFAVINYLFNCKPYTSLNVEKISHTGDTENMAYITIRYPESPFIAHLHLNWLSPVKIRKTIIGGSDKMLVWEDTNPEEPLKIYDKGIDVDEADKNNILISYRTGDVISPKIRNEEALANLINSFVDDIEAGYNILDPINIKVLEMLEATG